ncbi:UvrD-helicase domain-containing protein [Nitrospira sp. Nam74]
MTRVIREERIFGPPGTGKTTTLSALISEACKSHGSEQILVASFTRTAAKELAQRDLPLDDSQVGTLHALCYRALGKPKLAVGKALQDWNEKHPAYAHDQGDSFEAPDDLTTPTDMCRKRESADLVQEYHALRGRMVPRLIWPVKVQGFAELWEDWKQMTGFLDFTDLIEIAWRDTGGPPNQAAILFLDEVQDFSPLELALARRWASHMDRFVPAGDDDQCIYTFKGATPDAFLNPPLPADQIRVLSQSYRLPREVHRVATAWIEQITHRQPKAYLPRDCEGRVDMLPGWTWDYPDPLLRAIETHIQHGETVAVLASCGYMLGPTKRALRAAGMPFHNPYRPKRADWNPLGLNKREGTVTARERLLAFLKVSLGRGWWSYGELHQWASTLDTKGLLTHGAKSAIREAAEAKGDTPVSDADLGTWFLDERAAQASVDGDVRWFASKLLASQARPLEYACEVVAKHGAVALETPPKVTLGTIHSVKGGQADHVYLLPNLSPSATRAWYDGAGDGYEAVLRCFYVGITRARHSLFWGHPTGGAVEPMM